ncbi:hypothetical protein SAMN02745121_02844 [Nannocystis exedens]|uniref:Uncharacterized protein n=1 Tax=Nannocystis exedens TaxID=54 RepID=A0A1I1XGB3_9BACT|nr:hypothetical protein [Nannocystis exedens]PCC73427.1 hypothetical protein NAEX_06515 [Nannocystis exedens]SFE06405.1 hypothetical protein SAMN02745121_02844 [Nannocystis exedens]
MSVSSFKKSWRPLGVASASVFLCSAGGVHGGCGEPIQAEEPLHDVHDESDDVVPGQGEGIDAGTLELAAPASPSWAPGDRYAHCDQILSQGIFNKADRTFNYDQYKVVIASACAVLHTWNSTDQSAFKKDCGSDADTKTVDAGVNFVFGMIPVGGSGSWQTTDVDSWCTTESSRRARREEFYKSNCWSGVESHGLQTARTEVIRTADQGIVQAWLKCVESADETTILDCYGRMSADEEGLTFYVEYTRTNPILPLTLDLEWDTVNATAKTPLEVRMGEGNIIEYFTIDNLARSTKVIIKGSGGHLSTGNVSCEYELGPIEQKICDGPNIVGERTNRLYQANSPLCAEPSDQPPPVDEPLWIVQWDRLHLVNPENGFWTVLGGPVWPDATSMTARWAPDLKALYIIQNDRLHEVSPADGSYKVLPDQTGTPNVWGGPTSMAAVGDHLYIVQNSRLHRVNLDGRWQVLPDQQGLTARWHGTKAMAVPWDSNDLYIVQNDRLHRVDLDGRWEVLADQNGHEAVWGGPVVMTAREDHLYIVQHSRLHRVDLDGDYVVLPDQYGNVAVWGGATGITTTRGDDNLYIVRDSKLYRVTLEGHWEVLPGQGTTTEVWGGPVLMSG